jgi:hypothetical protein
MSVAVIKFDNKIQKFIASFGGEILGKSASPEYLENGIISGRNIKANRIGITSVQREDKRIEVNVGSPLPTQFSIDERFEFVAELTTMIANKVIPSVVLTGSGGLGKSYTVIKTLEANGLLPVAEEIFVSKDAEGSDVETSVEVGDFKVIKGFSTAKALYRTLYENRTGIVVLDDCDSIHKDPNATNVLKAALDSYSERWVSWNSENPFDGLPKRFLFTGQIIFISNFPQHKIDQAIRSRSMCVDLSMTLDQILQRMGTISKDPGFLPEISDEHKADALKLISRIAKPSIDITLRSLISIAKIRATAHEDKWEKLAEYVLTNN